MKVLTSLDVIGLGEVCIDWMVYVDRFPEIDEKVFVKGYKHFVGGVTANFMVAFARLGGRGGFLGGVGDDEYGRIVVNKLKNEGVDVSSLKVWSNRSTALNIVVVDKQGRKYIYQDPNLMLNVPEPEDLKEDYITSARHIHTTAIKVETAEKAFKIALKHGLTTSFDLEKHVSEYGLDGLREVLKYTHILMPNKLGIQSLTGERDFIVAARKIMKYGPKVVVITMGKKGCIVVTEDEVVKSPAFKVNVVDTTGAGDAFNAAFIYALVVKEWDYERAALFANAVAALKCARLGAQSSPYLNEVEGYLKSQGIRL